MKKLMFVFLAISSICYCQQPENLMDLVYREGVSFKLQNYRIVKGILCVVYQGGKKDSLVINLMVRDGEIVAHSSDEHGAIFLNLERNDHIFIQRPRDDKVSTAWFEFKDSYLEEKYDAALTVHVDYFLLFFKSKKKITEVYDGEKWRPIELKEYDTVKCIVQCYSPNNGLVFVSPQFHAVKGWVVRKVERRNNARPDAGFDPGYKYEEWNYYTPICFLLPNKKTKVIDVWMPNNEPQYILKDW